MFDRQAYLDFIAAKQVATTDAGFDPAGDWPTLFEHQKRALAFACQKGRAAAFLDTGLGKSRVEAAAADEFRRAANKPSLILTPLAVARQMQRECEAIGVEARVIRDDSEVTAGVNIANYERLGKLDVSRFGGVVLDESSILKSFSGPTKRGLVEAFGSTPYRLAATATPAPNDHMELGNHSEFLGYLGSMEMLCRWFINDTSTASQDWRLKGHAEKDFWAWVASWSRAASLPSDLGGDDDGFILPPLRYQVHTVAVDVTEDVPEGMLFRIPDQSATTIHKEKRLTLADRIGRVVEIVTGSICDKLAENEFGNEPCLGNLNTPQKESSDMPKTQNIGSAGLSSQYQTRSAALNTCADITQKTGTSGERRENSETKSTSGDGSVIKRTPNTLNNAESGPSRVIRTLVETAGSSQHTGSTPQNTTECSESRAEVAQSAIGNTATEGGVGCTSTIATKQEKSGDFYAPPATRRLASCATTQKGLSGRSFTFSAANLDPWLVFCETNDEQDALEAAFGDLCISIRGSDTVEKKERDIQRWLDGERPVFISKPRIVGYGLNFQHCNNVIFASISHSYEAFYQCVRRVWRFGQKRPVTAHVVISDTEVPIWQNVQRKANDHDRMKRAMSAAMVGAQRIAERKAYTRPVAVTLPSFIGGNNAT